MNGTVRGYADNFRPQCILSFLPPAAAPQGGRTPDYGWAARIMDG
ncbi:MULTISPECIES: hypothetical protein [Streptomyces]|uniref:Uncharacterized protein n=1 Tax=Streptomyces yanii TaxID=78510 RepID=A0ABV5RFM9_9ACTN